MNDTKLFTALLPHLTHKVEIVDYTEGGGGLASISLECTTCGDRLFEIDNPDPITSD